MLTRIHVNQHNIKANAKFMKACEAAEQDPGWYSLAPVLTVKDYKQNRKGMTAVVGDSINGPVCRVIYRPDDPLPCGAKVWIETDLPVTVE